MATGGEIDAIINVGAPIPVPITILSEEPPSKPKCPWGTIAASPPKSIPLSLNEIMSEQLADSLQHDEEEGYLKELVGDSKDIGPNDELDIAQLLSQAQADGLDTSNDELIAQMLQMQFNKEHDQDLRRVEQKLNGSSKISVSFSNYMVSPQYGDDSDSEEEDEELSRKAKQAWDSFEAHERSFPAMSGRGYVKINNTMVTKHDLTMSQRRNASKVMEFPPCIQTGDGAAFDMQLSNKVYNNLKTYSKAEEQRRTRHHDKSDKSTSEMAVDPKTKLLLYKMINNCVLKKIYGIISTGKESVILYADGGCMETESGETIVIPEECALKIFKTTLNEFKTRDKYIRDDYRFKDRFSKQNPRKVIHMWAEKEMHNLNRMTKAGIPCPKVVLLKKHVLILEFIGKDGCPAPKLKEVKFTDDDGDKVLLQSAYHQIVEAMHQLYNKCNLVHGDLSEYNVLWHKNKCYFIDVSQSVEPHHPNALEFLYRDCTNICTFFGKKHLENIHTPESLFTHISGFQLEGTSGPEILNQIMDYEKNVERLTFSKPEKSYPFEYCWEQEHPSTSPKSKTCEKKSEVTSPSLLMD